LGKSNIVTCLLYFHLLDTRKQKSLDTERKRKKNSEASKWYRAKKRYVIFVDGLQLFNVIFFIFVLVRVTIAARTPCCDLTLNVKLKRLSGVSTSHVSNSSLTVAPIPRSK
jgi:hypothetical protein